MFSPDLLKEFFSYSKHFIENEKGGNHLVKGLVNMVYGVEQTWLNPIFFPARFFC